MKSDEDYPATATEVRSQSKPSHKKRVSSSRATDELSKPRIEEDRERRRRARELILLRRQQRRSVDGDLLPVHRERPDPEAHVCLHEPTYEISSSHRDDSKNRKRQAKRGKDSYPSNGSAGSDGCSPSRGHMHKKGKAKRQEIFHGNTVQKYNDHPQYSANDCNEQHQMHIVEDEKRSRPKHPVKDPEYELGGEDKHEYCSMQGGASKLHHQGRESRKVQKRNEIDGDHRHNLRNSKSNPSNQLQSDREKRKQKLEKVKSDIMQRMNKLSNAPTIDASANRNPRAGITASKFANEAEQQTNKKDGIHKQNSDLVDSTIKSAKGEKSRKRKSKNGTGSSIADSSINDQQSRSETPTVNVTLEDLDLDKWVEESRKFEEPCDFLSMHNTDFDPNNGTLIMPQGDDLDEENLSHLKRIQRYNLSWVPEGKGFLYALGAGVVLLLAIIVIFVVVVLGRDNDPPYENNTAMTTAPTKNEEPTASPTTAIDGLFSLLSELAVDGGDTLLTTSSPQEKAYNWLLGNSKLGEYSRVEKIQRYVLSVLYYSTMGDEWFNKDGWLSDKKECEWFTSEEEFPICNLVGALDELDLNTNNLQGTLPWAELSFLKDRLLVVDVLDNDIGGNLPTIVGEMTSLVVLDLFSNKIESFIPTEIGKLGHKLKYIDWDSNMLTGTLPTELGSLTSLETLWLNNNLISGTVPSELGLIKHLKNLYLAGNVLTGTIPPEVCSLQLENLEISCDEVQCDCCSKCV